MLFLLTECIFQVKSIHAQLVRHDHINIIRHFPCHPVMAADSLQPPDLILILKSDTIHLIGSILLKQASQSEHTFSGTIDIRKHDIYNILFTDSSRNLLLTVFCRLVLHQRVCTEHPRIGCDGLCCCHGHMSLIDTAGCPDPFSFKGIRH